MPTSPLVSIITPSYNQAAFLEQTIHSVLAQDYSPIEYLIVDGASADGSAEIIQRYADRLAWWISESDTGQAEAINKGLKQARGEIVAWLNSDDLYLPGAIAEAVAILEQNPELGMVFGDAITIDPQGKPLNKLKFGDWGLPELMRFRIICQPAVFMRRTVLDKAGSLDPGYHFLLDHHLWIRIARLAPIYYAGSADISQNPKSDIRKAQNLNYPPGLWAAARHHPAAKNVAQSAGFGREAFRVLEWMQAQPDLAPQVENNRNRVQAGAHRLNARYLLDGNMPREALRAYWQSFLLWPSFALKHWHRMIYAALCLPGANRVVDYLRASTSARQSKHLRAELRDFKVMSQRKTTLETPPSSVAAITSLKDWPGLCLAD